MSEATKERKKYVKLTDEMKAQVLAAVKAAPKSNSISLHAQLSDMDGMVLYKAIRTLHKEGKVTSEKQGRKVVYTAV